MTCECPKPMTRNFMPPAHFPPGWLYACRKEMSRVMEEPAAVQHHPSEHLQPRDHIAVSSWHWCAPAGLKSSILCKLTGW